MTFERFHALLERYSAGFRADVFDGLPAYMQESCWAQLVDEIDRERHDELHDPILDYEPPPARAPRSRAMRPPSSFTGPRSDAEDPLLEIPPAEYVEHLADVEVPSSGVIRCPLPNHDDRTPSFKVYPDAERGVWGHGCQRGGSIYDFASALEGGPIGSGLRGEAFKAVRAWVLARFCHAGDLAA